MQAPYKPIEQFSLKFLSHKVAFLLAKCSAKRVSELHALSVSEDCLRWKANDSGLSLWPNPSFLPKIINPQTVCRNCMHAVSEVLTQLFILLGGKKSGLPVSIQGVCFSHCIVNTIAEAYSGQNLPVLDTLVGHSTRSVARSWAALRGVPLFFKSVQQPHGVLSVQVLQGQRGILHTIGFHGNALNCCARMWGSGFLCSPRHCYSSSKVKNVVTAWVRSK